MCIDSWCGFFFLLFFERKRISTEAVLKSPQMIEEFFKHRKDQLLLKELTREPFFLYKYSEFTKFPFASYFHS